MRIDFSTFEFAEPLYLWLLILPAGLMILWIRQVLRRRADVRRWIRERVVPIPERYNPIGDVAYWMCLLLAASLCIVALARPQARISTIRKGSADIVLLLDGSASMYVRDVQPDRWRRSVRFVRAFADALSWKGDRVALALFAHLASPQIRLTRDPNALFFFVDHLGEHSPFLLEEAPTWDTNIEEGLYWGLKLVEKDEELYGKSRNVTAFVVISDGQAWTGEVANVLAATRQRSAPVYVVGVGTMGGGFIPEPPRAAGETENEPLRSVLDRESLRQIARAGGGEYFELGTESDRDIASKILVSIRRRARASQLVESYEEMYWHFLFAAGIVLCLGVPFVKGRVELVGHAATSLVAALILASVLG